MYPINRELNEKPLTKKSHNNQSEQHAQEFNIFSMVKNPDIIMSRRCGSRRQQSFGRKNRRTPKSTPPTGKTGPAPWPGLFQPYIWSGFSLETPRFQF